MRDDLPSNGPGDESSMTVTAAFSPLAVRGLTISLAMWCRCQSVYTQERVSDR